MTNPSIYDGGPAFPVSDDPHDVSLLGMSLRDYFAAKVMQGICAYPGSEEWSAENIAKGAYMQADAMLKERQP